MKSFIGAARRAIAIGLLGLIGVLGTGTAAAAEEPVPPGVAAAFRDDALAFIAADGQVPEMADASAIGTVHEIFTWTAAFVSGESTSRPFESTRQWVATVLAGPRAIGTVLVWLPDGVNAEVAGYNDDAELGAALETVGDAAYVQDELSGAAYVVDGVRVEPLNKRATAELPLAASVSDFQKRMLARAAEAKDDELPPAVTNAADDAVGAAITAWTAALALLTIGAVVAVIVVLRRRRVHATA